jgi:hypothetical protein
MSLYKILKSSFEMLLERPQIFVPRILSASISSLALIGWILGYLGSIQFLVLFPLITVLGAFTPVIVSSMVKAAGDARLLKKGFEEALHLWKPIFGFAFITMILGFLASLPISVGLAATYFTGEIIYLAIGGSIGLLITLFIAFSIYFVPITILENKGIVDSFKDSFRTSSRNRKDVMLLTLFSVIVLGASSLTTGQLRNIGLSMFFLGRIISSIVGTYLIVVSPNYYLKREDSDES